MPDLFDSLSLRSITLRNRIGVSPMCQYVADDGRINDWHLVHLGSRAVGGAGLVIMEATAVEPIGRISPGDTGLWNDQQIKPLQRLTSFISDNGAVPGIQLAHAGRKASTAPPAEGGGFLAESKGGWQPVAPSPIPFFPDDPPPEQLSEEEIEGIINRFADSAARARQAGFKLVEIHAAHGYLLHSFLSPLSNQRTDSYGGSFENRTRLLLAVAEAVRSAWPEDLPLAVRISASDWYEGGWEQKDSLRLAPLLAARGVDLIDCSSGGATREAKYPAGPNWQVRFATAVRETAGVATAAVGLITSPMQADAIVRTGQADLVLLGREFLRNPYWPVHAARELRKTDKLGWPASYDWAL